MWERTGGRHRKQEQKRNVTERFRAGPGLGEYRWECRWGWVDNSQAENQFSLFSKVPVTEMTSQRAVQMARRACTPHCGRVANFVLVYVIPQSSSV